LIRISSPAVRQAAWVSLAFAFGVAAVGAWWLYATRVAGDPFPARFVAWTLAGGVATALLAIAMARTFRPIHETHRPSDGGSPSIASRIPFEPPAARPEMLRSLGLPNALTLVRFVLIAPTVVLLVDGRNLEALVCYIVLFATDVADGIVARRRGLTSEFGVVADPLADVASTFAIFTVFVLQGLCPLWLYALLAFRYAMLFVGSVGLFWTTGPFEFRATIPGKIVGVVQAAGASLVMVGPLWGGLTPGTEGVLFPILGIGFASIVVSQAIIGWRLARRR
jgi:phosphatidylglycerophosphate synthase